MKKYVIAGIVLAVGLFIMNGCSMMIRMAFAHVIAFFLKAILLTVFGAISIGVLWRLVGGTIN